MAHRVSCCNSLTAFICAFKMFYCVAFQKFIFQLYTFSNILSFSSPLKIFQQSYFLRCHSPIRVRHFENLLEVPIPDNLFSFSAIFQVFVEHQTLHKRGSRFFFSLLAFFSLILFLCFGLGFIFCTFFVQMHAVNNKQ